MRQLTNSVSTQGHVRRETKNDIEYLVFPSIIAKEGVLDYPEFGRAEYLPAEHLEQTVDRWADMPITVNHPPDRGEGRTAKVPESYTSEVIGRTFNPEIVNGDRVRVENWVDIERANSFGGIYAEMVDLLESGRAGQIGVSTGYGTVGDEYEDGNYRGNSYSLRQGLPDPNHVALVTPDQTPRMSPADGVGAPRLNHVTMSPDPGTSTDTTTDGIDIGAFQTALRRMAESVGLRVNQQSGDAVRWESSAGGSREPDSYRYGVVVDGLDAEDEPDDSLLVAVYRANSDRDGWENTGDQEVIQEDTLEVVGNDGVESLPAVSDVVTNTVNSSEEEDEEEGDSEEEEADDSDEADSESTDETTTSTDGDGDGNGDDPDDDDEDEDEDEREDEGKPPGDHSGSSESDTDSDNDTDDTSDSTDSTTTMSDTDNDDNDRIKRLAQDEGVPFDEGVLEEFDDAQLDTIDPDTRADDDEGDNGDDDGEGDDDPTGGEPTNPDDAEGETQETESTESPETPETPGDDGVSEVEEKVNALEERFEEKINTLEEENEELRKKADPDVVQRMNAIGKLADHYDTDEGEFEHLGKETAVQMANDLSDGTRENSFDAQQQNRTNMIGAPGGIDRTNAEDESEKYPAGGRSEYESRNNGSEADD